VASSSRLWFLVVLDRSGGRATVTAETIGEASPGEASFQLLAEHLPDLIIFAFDADLRMWAATGGGLRARGWTSERFIGMTVPEIAEATRAEERLQASQRQLAEAQRIAQVGSWGWDLETDELTVSDELCRLFGLPVGIKLTMAEGVAVAIHPDDQEGVATALGRIRDDPSAFVLEHRIIRSDGDVRTVMARGEGVLDEDGRVVRFIGTDQDITERRRADAERRRLLNRVYEAQEGQGRGRAAALQAGHVQSLAEIGFKLEQARLRLGASGSPEADELLWQVTKD